MFTIYDLAEIGACTAAFVTMLFVLVRKPKHLSAHLYVTTALSSGIMWLLFIVIVPRYEALSTLQQGILVSSVSIASGVWLIFLLVFAREPGKSIFRKRSLWVYGAYTLLVIASVAAFFNDYFFLMRDEEGIRFFEITSLGRYFLAFLIIANAFGLLQLESTYRAAQGSARRPLLPVLIVTAALFGLNIVTGMMGLLIARIEFLNIELCALVMTVAMIMVSRYIVRHEQPGQGVVVSREAVYSSMALVLVGAYFILIGIAIKVLLSLGGHPQVFLSVLAAFVLIVLFTAIAMSGSIRRRWRAMVDRSLFSGRADLLTEITRFADDVSAATSRNEMFEITAEILQQRCSMNDVQVYLSTSKPGEVLRRYPETSLDTFLIPELEEWLFRVGRVASTQEFRSHGSPSSVSERDFLAAIDGCELIPLVARKEFVGFVTCRSESAIGEDVRFLINSISHQLALSLLSARQSEALLETRELASFTKVSSFVIHDVKNLISMLSMILQNAERRFEDPRFQQLTTETLQSAQERMKRMINRLSSPSQQIDFALTRCDLQGILVDLVNEMKLNTNPKIRLSMSYEGIPAVVGNEEKLSSVISNLLINAIEAMPSGGDLKISGSFDDNFVQLMVCDSGVGMTTEFMRERLFRPFQTSKSSGLGIGLYQSRELVEQMGGSLFAESSVGKGSSFRMKLKRAGV